MSKKLLNSVLSLIVLMSMCDVYAETAVAAVIFSDDFEGYADQAALELVWTKASTKPNILNTEQNHTPGGEQSVWSTHVEGGIAGDQYAYIQFSDDPIECSIEAWFYDTGEADTFGGVLASPDLTPSNKWAEVEVGLFPWGGGFTNYYSYYDATGDWETKSSGIAWSVGWHKVEIVFAASGGAIYLDDIPLVTNSPNLINARRLWLGNPWLGANPMYFDDVTVTRAVAIYKATQPVPPDTSTNIATTPTLSWTAGDTATSHDVYFGTDLNDVNDATRVSSEFKGNQPKATYAPGTLTFGNTYYWRIDEVDASNKTYKGDVWRFLVSPTCDTFPAGDINRDCVVDLKDFAAFAATWLDCNINNGACP